MRCSASEGGGTARELCALIDELKVRVRSRFGLEGSQLANGQRGDIAALIEAEVAEAEGGEDQLTGEAEKIERPRAVLAAEAAQGVIILAQ